MGTCIEWSLKNDGSWHIFGESESLNLKLIKNKAGLKSRILKFESRKPSESLV